MHLLAVFYFGLGRKNAAFNFAYTSMNNFEKRRENTDTKSGWGAPLCFAACRDEILSCLPLAFPSLHLKGMTGS